MLKNVNNSNSSHREKYRADIDGVRAIAVSSVVLSHAFPSVLPGGFIGVDIFFVISGYLISSNLMRTMEEGSFSALEFYTRRIRRIFPSLIVILSIVMILGWIFLFKQELSVLGHHIVASALFSENFVLWNEAGYFDVASNAKPALHLWSLAIEEQFYILWPMFIYLGHKLRINFTTMIATLGLLSFFVNLHHVYTDPTAAYFSPVDRSWELMIGAFLARIQANFPTKLVRYKDVQSFAGLTLIAVALVFVRPERAFPGFWALLPTLGSFLLISGGENAWVNRRLLAAKPMVWCGLISYPLYLWHWPLLSYAHILFGNLSVASAICIILIAVAAATLTFFLVERPFRRPEEGTRKAFFLLGNMMATLVCGVLIMGHLISGRLDDVDAPTKTEWDFLRQRAKFFDRDGIGVYSLDAERANLALFIGDSRIAQYAARLGMLMDADPDRPGAVLAIGGGCAPIEGVRTDDVKRAKCWPQRDEAYKMAEETKFGTIVIGGAWNWYFLAGDYVYQGEGRTLPLTSPEGRGAALRRLEKRVKTLTQSGKHVVFVLDNPVVKQAVFTAWQLRLGLSSEPFRPSRTVAIDPEQLKLKEELSRWASRAGASVVDPFDAVCSREVCQVTTATGQFMFKDAGHFNPDWAIAHADFIDEALRK